VTLGYRLSKAAQKDLADIYRYTREKFGKAQAESYISSLRESLALIAGQPLMGPERTELTPPVRVHPHGQHIIVYVPEGERPLIVRIVSGKQHWQPLLSS
jgi:toxin ParE1/3/4